MRVIFLLIIFSGAIGADEGAVTALRYGYRVAASFPHDPAAFTQGLMLVDGQLFESIGRYGQSALRRVDMATGRVEQETRLAANVFAEGITDWRGQIVQLTWREGLGLIYAREQLQPIDYFEYSGEGWGITHNDAHWIVSDGTPVLRFIDPVTRRVVRQLTVRDGERPLAALNELEWIAGEVWANVWQQEVIARINPDSGAVTGWVDLRGLRPAAARLNREAVLNGIAYDAASGRIFVTGKHWPRLYQIELMPTASP